MIKLPQIKLRKQSTSFTVEEFDQIILSITLSNSFSEALWWLQQVKKAKANNNAHDEALIALEELVVKNLRKEYWMLNQITELFASRSHQPSEHFVALLKVRLVELDYVNSFVKNMQQVDAGYSVVSFFGER